MMFDSVTKEGLIIDPVKEQFDRNLQFIEELGVELKYVIDTHVHADHVTSAGMLRQATGAKSALGENAISVNKEKVAENYIITKDDLINNKFVLLQKGKKNYYVIVVN